MTEEIIQKIEFVYSVESQTLNGDIVITDPCYIHHNINKDELWMDVVNTSNIPSLIKTSTIFGDWRCTVYEITSDNKNKEIGKFSADAGMVCCCLLSDVLNYNPKFKEFIEDHKNCVTIIKGFNGTVEFNKYKVIYKYENELCEDFIIKVEGKGKKYGKSFRFKSEQTSL